MSVAASFLSPGTWAPGQHAVSGVNPGLTPLPGPPRSLVQLLCGPCFCVCFLVLCSLKRTEEERGRRPRYLPGLGCGQAPAPGAHSRRLSWGALGSRRLRCAPWRRGLAPALGSPSWSWGSCPMPRHACCTVGRACHLRGTSPLRAGCPTCGPRQASDRERVLDERQGRSKVARGISFWKEPPGPGPRPAQ